MAIRPGGVARAAPAPAREAVAVPALTTAWRFFLMPPMTTPATLVPHPASPAGPARRIVASWALDRDFLEFRYALDGDAGLLAMPPRGGARRSDGLWQHSCFEAFLRPDSSDAYYEFNFAPSGDWAAYRFAARRAQRTLPYIAPPLISLEPLPDGFAVSARIDLAPLPELAGAGAIDAGLAAVIEAADGALAYWALAHGGEKPDFHDPATFVLRLPLR
jgi:hypothetical protein